MQYYVVSTKPISFLSFKNCLPRARDLKSSGLIHGLSFRIQADLNVHRVSLKNWFSILFGRFHGFWWEQDSTLSLILHYNQPKLVLFSLGLKVGFRELRLNPKFLIRGLR